MRILCYTTVDVYYNKTEQKVADKKRKQLERQGYELNLQDEAPEPFDYCDQYIKYIKSKLIITNNKNQNHEYQKES